MFWTYVAAGSLFSDPDAAIGAAIEWWATAAGTNPSPEPIISWGDEDIAGAAECLNVRPRWGGDLEAEDEANAIRRLLAQRIRDLQRTAPDYRPGAKA